MRRIVAILTGVIIAGCAIEGAWYIAERWFPAPLSPDASINDMLAHFVTRMPLGGQALIAIGWLLAGLAGGFVALRISQWRPSGWIVLVFVLGVAAWDLSQLAHPWWLTGATILLPILGCWLAERHFHRARPGDPLIN